MAKQKGRRWLLWLGLIPLVVGLALAAWLWSIRWAPDRGAYPVQGVWLDAANGPVEWPTLKANGADFVYLTASVGANTRDAAFPAGFDAARAAGLQVGAVHVYDLCAPADAQASNFVTIVARDKRMLPTAIAIMRDAKACPTPPGEAVIDSELTTFLNEVERHLGRPVVLMPSAEIEAQYHLAARIDRNVWVTRDWFAPHYGQRPWALWTASHRRHVPGVVTPVRWVVAS